MLGGKVKLFISGAASLDPAIEERYRLLGINIVQGYGLTETSQVVAIGTNKEHKIGSIGKTVPSVKAKLVDINKEGVGELVVKGPSIALGYYNNEKATTRTIRSLSVLEKCRNHHSFRLDWRSHWFFDRHVRIRKTP